MPGKPLGHTRFRVAADIRIGDECAGIGAGAKRVGPDALTGAAPMGHVASGVPGLGIPAAGHTGSKSRA